MGTEPSECSFFSLNTNDFFILIFKVKNQYGREQTSGLLKWRFIPGCRSTRSASSLASPSWVSRGCGKAREQAPEWGLALFWPCPLRFGLVFLCRGWDGTVLMEGVSRASTGDHGQAWSRLSRPEVSTLPETECKLGNLAEAGARVSTQGAAWGSFLPLLKALRTTGCVSSVL